jgi:hypothetical protein
MPAFSYTISNPVKGATATYTFSYTTATNVGVAPATILMAVWPFGFTVDDIANVSVTVNGVPQTMDGSGFLGSRSLFARITSAVPAGSHVVLTVANVLNHAAPGSFAFATLPNTVDDLGTTIDVPASVSPIVILDALPSYTLHYAAGAHGSVTGSSTQVIASGANGTSVTAVPATGYHFTSWSDASTTNPRTDTNVSADATLTASFAIDTHTVTYGAGAGGTLTGTLSQVVDYGSSTAAVLAVPDSGFAFTSWSDASTTNPRTDAGVIADLSVTAAFAAVPADVEERSGSGRSGGSVQSRVANLTSSGNTVAASALMAQYPNLFGSSSAAPVPAGPAASSAVRDLTLGMSGEDVRSLQKLLNANGAALASSGVGSVGNETDFFGTLTQQALAAYQAAHGIDPAIGYFGVITRAEMGSRGLEGLWW